MVAKNNAGARQRCSRFASFRFAEVLIVSMRRVSPSLFSFSLSLFGHICALLGPAGVSHNVADAAGRTEAPLSRTLAAKKTSWHRAKAKTTRLCALKWHMLVSARGNDSWLLGCLLYWFALAMGRSAKCSLLLLFPAGSLLSPNCGIDPSSERGPAFPLYPCKSTPFPFVVGQARHRAWRACP